MVETLSVARDFSPFPAGRKRADGPYTGERFREDFLKPRLAKAGKTVLKLDGVEGLPSSFWEEIFGGLVRQGFSVATLRDSIEIVTSEPDLEIYPDMAWRFARAAENLH